MGHVYKELNPIPRPAFSHTDKQEVYIWESSENGKRRRISIGIVASKYDGTFHPNDAFRLRYPGLWMKHFGEDTIPSQIRFGLYAMYLGAGFQDKVYPLLQKVYSIQTANAIMDFSMFVASRRLNVAQIFESSMNEEMLFSQELHGDSWYSEIFNCAMNEDINHEFRIKWIEECRRKYTKVWICIDGSNNDCYADSELCGKGEAKSKKNCPLVSYIYAVASDGTPVTYFADKGGKVDSKLFMKMCDFLEQNQMCIEGYILDRGFVTHDVLARILTGEHNYVIMLKDNTYGHTQMLETFGHRIFWDTRYAVTETLLGVSSALPLQIFKHESEKGYVHMFFDMKNAPARFVTLYQKVFRAKAKADGEIKDGKKASIPKGLKKYLRIKVDEQGNQLGTVIIHEELTQNCRMKGFFSIATSMPATPIEVDRLYNLRDVSEVTFMIIKSMLGFHVTRGHSTTNILNRMFVCFVTSIIRNAFRTECEALGYDTNQMMTKLEQVKLIRANGKVYFAPDDWGNDCEAILGRFGIGIEDRVVFAADYNRRLNDEEYDQYRYMPEETKKRLGLAGKKEQENAEEPEPGKPEETDQLSQSQNQVTAAKRRGRPPGRKNNKTLEREAAEAERIELAKAMGINPEPVKKRGRGRPPGSKNKKTIEREAQAAKELERMKLSGIEPAPKRGRGRPPGRKNNKTLAREKAKHKESQ